MNQTPLFTIAIPTFNRGNIIGKTLKSLTQQTYKNFELIISDNASTDSTSDIINEFKEIDVIYFKQKELISPQNNFNFLLEKAKGKYFIIHQDDDLLHKDFLYRAYLAFKSNPEIAFYSCASCTGKSNIGISGIDYKFTYGPSIPIDYFNEENILIDGLDAIIMTLFDLPFLMPGIAMNTEKLRNSGGFFKDFTFCMDNITLAHLANQGHILYDSRVGAFSLVHETNYSKNLNQYEEAKYRKLAIEIILNILDKNYPNWESRVIHLLKNLPRRNRWKYLTQSWEENYPGILKKLISRSLSNNNNTLKYHLRTILLKTRWTSVIKNTIN